jgi:hypothetical protein
MTMKIRILIKNLSTHMKVVAIHEHIFAEPISAHVIIRAVVVGDEAAVRGCVGHNHAGAGVLVYSLLDTRNDIFGDVLQAIKA